MHHSRGKEMIFQPVPAAAGRVDEEMAIMAEIGRIISSSLRIEEVYERFAEETRKLIPFERISVNLLNPDRKTFTITYVAGMDVPGRRPGEEYSITGTISETVIGNRKGMLVLSDDSNDMSKKYPNSRALKAGMLSSICVPLISMAAMIGTLHFQIKKLNAYSEHDLHLAERIASYITGAVANAKLFSSLTKTEAILRESETRYRAIFEQAAVGVAEIEFSTSRFLTVNRRLCEMLGYSEREMLDMTFQSITHPEDRDLHQEQMRLFLAGKIPNFVIAKRFLRKGGEPVWVNITISALWKEGERPRNNLAIVQDITEQKRAETALMQSEVRYRTLFESAGDYIFVLRPDPRKGLVILDANRAAIEKHGDCREELIGRSVLELNTPDTRAKKEELLRLLTKPGDTLLLEAEHVGKNGQTFPVEVSARMIQIEPESPFILAIERDITDRKRIERELSKSKEASERLRQEMAIITEIGRKISSTLNIDEVYDRLAAESAKLIDYHRMMVALLDPSKERFTVVYFSGAILPERKVGDSFPVKDSISELVSKRRAGVIIQAADKQGIFNACPQGGVDGVMRMGILSLMCVPLISQDEVIGVTHFRSKRPNAYTEQDLRLAEGLGRDIAAAIANARLYSDLKKTEKSFREGKELYSRLIDAVPDGVVQTDSDGKILLANEVALKTWGYTDMDEIRGKNLFAFVAPKDRRRAEENSRLRAEGKIDPQTYRLMVGDGRAITAEINANVLRTEEGTPYGKVMLFRDVTDRNRMEEALRASEAKYRFLTDNMNDVIWTVDLNLKTTYINRTIEKLLGYSPEEFMEKDLAEKCTPESYDHLQKVIAEQMEIEKSGSGDPERIITIEVEYYHKEGSAVWMESLISGMRDKNGVLTGYHGVSRNIMERKKLEQELRKILDNLENRIQERTIELEEVNTALRVLLKKGEQDLRKLGHDVKYNIDRLVMPFLRKLRTSPSMEQNRTYVNIIETNLMHITSPFINQLSDSFKNLTPKEIQVAAMIRDGRSSKEIAEILGVSVGTVVTHRNSIRKKLKLSSRDINLRSRLLSLA